MVEDSNQVENELKRAEDELYKIPELLKVIRKQKSFYRKRELWVGQNHISVIVLIICVAGLC